VVWKQIVLLSLDYFFGLLRKNHSGMETNLSLHFLTSCIGLRKNHSGMETFNIMFSPFQVAVSCVRTIVVWKPFTMWLIRILLIFGCVRTIVVWKLGYAFSIRSLAIALRKNHSGMETSVPLPYRLCRNALRKNHSGMETWFAARGAWGRAPGLRKNHSGMETSKTSD